MNISAKIYKVAGHFFARDKFSLRDKFSTAELREKKKKNRAQLNNFAKDCRN